jgi:hypothetical protein
MYRIAKIFQHRRLSIVIILIAFFLGFVTGFYTLYFFQKRTDTIAIIISVITLGLSSSGFSGLFYHLIKQKHEEESALRLEFEKINPDNDMYYLRVKKNEKAVGEIKDAEGFITIKDTNTENILTVWTDNNEPKNSISIMADLRLFRIQDEKNIIFYSPIPKQESTITELEPKSYHDYKDKEIVVKIGSSNAPTFTYNNKIRDIVKENK